MYELDLNLLYSVFLHLNNVRFLKLSYYVITTFFNLKRSLESTFIRNETTSIMDRRELTINRYIIYFDELLLYINENY